MCLLDVNNNQGLQCCVIRCTAANRNEPQRTAMNRNDLQQIAAGKSNRIEARCPMNRNEMNRSNGNRSRTEPFMNRTGTNRTSLFTNDEPHRLQNRTTTNPRNRRTATNRTAITVTKRGTSIATKRNEPQRTAYRRERCALPFCVGAY